MRKFLICMAATAALLAAALPATAEEAQGVSEIDISFTVRNINRSVLPCGTDGATYTLHGTVIGPTEKLAQDRIDLATVYVHDFTAGAWFWRLPEADYVKALARSGQVSVVFDRLGYGSSPLTTGFSTCLGAQADMLHQVIEQVRDGSDGAPAVDKVILAGHSVGAGIAELEAASFRDVDGLALMSWADAGPSLRAITEAAAQTSSCLLGGDRRAPQRGYGYFGQSPDAFTALLFRTASPDVRAAAVSRRSADPCGDVLTLAPMIALNNVLTHTIKVPVLLLFGQDDVLIRPDSRILQPLAYALGTPVTYRTLPDTGSALPLEAAAPQARLNFLDWVGSTFEVGLRDPMTPTRG